MQVDLFIRSYYKDFGWLRHCLRSIDKFCHGFGEVIVVIPRSSVERSRRAGIDDLVTTVVCDDYRDDYLGQQVTKLMADTYSGSDFICHVDSDCVFRRDTTPHDLIAAGKPTCVITPYKLFPEQAAWRRLSEQFLRREIHHDFMRRQPLVFPRHLYGELRAFARSMHGVNLEDYVLSQPPRGFSEYNALGGYAFYHRHDAITWMERTTWEPDEQFCRWFWSWGGISPEIEAEIESILA